jgi:hypothetical protein
MRKGPLVALATVAVTVGAAVVVSCSDAPSCKPGTVALSVLLLQTAFEADSIVVTSSDPMLSQTMTRTANDPTAFTIDVAFPNGYPTDKVVTFLVRAYATGILLGENTAAVHLHPNCETASIEIVGGNTLDAFVTD